MTNEHTPTPWTADGEMIYAQIGDAPYGKRVADCTPNECEDEEGQEFAEREPEANAEMIARAVNSYDGFERTLKWIEDKANKGANGGLNVPGKANSVADCKALLREIRDAAREVLSPRLTVQAPSQEKSNDR